MKKNNKRNKANKRKSAIAGGLLVGAILIGGTFAFSQLQQQAITPDWHEAFGGGGRIHNIAQGNTGNSDFGVNGERNHDIFAENFSDIPLGVRVQLREFLEINGEEVVNMDETNRRRAIPVGELGHIAANAYVYMDLNDFSTWSLFNAAWAPINDDATPTYGIVRQGTSHVIGEAGIEWTLGQESNVKIFMPTFNQINRSLELSELLDGPQVGFNRQNAYRFVDTTGRAIAVDAGTNILTADEVREVTGQQTGVLNPEGLQNFWNLTDNNTHEAYLYTVEAGRLVRSEYPVEHQAKATLAPDEGGIMLLSQWVLLDEADQGGNFWIFDDLSEEAWFFWNGFIPAGEATSLLLDAVFLTGTDNLDYVIHVTADFFSAHTLELAEIHPDLLPRFMEIDEPSVDINYEFDMSVITLTEHATNGLVIGTEGVIAENFILRRYEDGEFVEYVENVVFEYEILEANTTSTLTMNSPLTLIVGADEPNDLLTIQVTEQVTGDIFTVEINIWAHYWLEIVNPIIDDVIRGNNISAEFRMMRNCGNEIVEIPHGNGDNWSVSSGSLIVPQGIYRLGGGSEGNFFYVNHNANLGINEIIHTAGGAGLTVPQAHWPVHVLEFNVIPATYWFERTHAIVTDFPRGSTFSINWGLMHFNGSEIINLGDQYPLSSHGWNMLELETNPHMTLVGRGATGGTFVLLSDAPLGSQQFTISIAPSTPTTALSIPQSEWPTYTFVINVTP